MPVTIGGLIAGAVDAIAGAAAAAPEIGLGVEAGAAADIGATAAGIGAADVGAAGAIGAGAASAFDVGAGAVPFAAETAAGGLPGLGLGAGEAGAAAGALGDVAIPAAGEAVTGAVPFAGIGSAAGAATAADVLGGATGPLAAIGATAAPTFETAFTGDIAALEGAGSLPGDVSAFAPATATDTGLISPGISEAFSPVSQADITAAINTGQIPAGSATEQTVTDLAAGVDPTLQTVGAGGQIPGQITPEGLSTPGGNIASTAGTPLSSYEGAVATPANPNVGGQFGEPAPVAAAAGGTSGLGSALRTAGMLAPLGALGLTLARGQPSLPPAEQQALNNIGPIQSFATSQITAAQNNQITPAQAAQISTYKQNAQNQLYQFYARMGRDPTNDTDYIQGLQQIDQNAVAMQQQFIDSMIKNGLTAAGVVDSTLQSAAKLQVANDNAFQQSINSAMSSFGLVAAINTIGAKA